MRDAILTVLVLTGGVVSSGSVPLAAEAETACGDVNGDAAINITDAIHLLTYLYLGGDAPVCSVTQPPDEEASCDSFSQMAVEACKHDALARYWRENAMCYTLTDPTEGRACREALKARLRSTLDECRAQFKPRLDLCEVLGASAYGETPDPQDFVDRVDNPYMPLAPGLVLVYESRTAEGKSRTEVKVTSEIREILGVKCVVVRQVETLDGEDVEETEEWFAQDSSGNVWNFGEQTFGFEDSEVADWGWWQAGIEGAKPGIVMRGSPQPGEVYRQGFALGVSEDIGRVLTLSGSVPHSTSVFGNLEHCLQVEESSLLENEVEHKFFAPGVGMVLEVNMESGERTELVERSVSPAE